MHGNFETLGKYLLFTTYLTSTTAQQKKRAQIGPTEILVGFSFFFKAILKFLSV